MKDSRKIAESKRFGARRYTFADVYWSRYDANEKASKLHQKGMLARVMIDKDLHGRKRYIVWEHP